MAFFVVAGILLIAVMGKCNGQAVTLARGFFLPEVDIYSPLVGGISVYKTLNSSCYRWERARQTLDHRSSFKDTSSFYKLISSDSNIDVNLIGKVTMGVTIGLKTKSLSSGTIDVTGTSVEIGTYVNTTYIDEDCFLSTELNNDLIKAFDNLPEIIQTPWLKSSWDRYELFLKTFGTHFVTKSHHGVVIRQWTFSKAESKYSLNQLNVRSCLDLGVVSTSGALDVKACSGVTTEEAESIRKLEMSNYLEIYGGSDETRNQFRTDRNQEVLERLLNEGQDMQTPIAYEYEAIWDTLKQKFQNNPERYAKAITLKEFYYGFYDFGCAYQHIDSTKLRAFEYTLHSSLVTPKFQCSVISDGCHENSDCHHHLVEDNDVGFCYGKSCYEYSQQFGAKATSVSVREELMGKHDDGVNESCKYQKAGVICERDSTDYYVIWNSDIANYADPTSKPKPNPPTRPPNRSGKLKYSAGIIFIFLIIFVLVTY